MELRDKRVLILGGTGLIASHVIELLIKERFGVITLLANNTERKARLLKAITSKLKPHPIVTIQRDLLADTFINQQNARLESSFLYKVVKKEKPDVIIDGINTATIVSHQALGSFGTNLLSLML